MAKRWDVPVEEVSSIVEGLSYTPYLPLSDADILQISKALDGGDSYARGWSTAVSTSKKRANRRCRESAQLVLLARQDFFNISRAPFPRNLRAARAWLEQRFPEARADRALPGDDGLTLPEEDHLTPDWDARPDVQSRQPPRTMPEGSWERLNAWASLTSGAAIVTPAQALSYILIDDVGGAEPPIRITVIEKVGRSPVVQMSIDPYVSSDLVQRAYALVARTSTGRKRARPGPKETTARTWPQRLHYNDPRQSEEEAVRESAEATLSWMEAIAMVASGPVCLSLTGRTVYDAPAVRYSVRPYAVRQRFCRSSNDH